MLDTLLKWVRNNAISVEQWDEHFKSILLILIETFGDSDVSTLWGVQCVCVWGGVVKINAIKIKINAWVCSDGSDKDLSDSEVCVGCDGGCLLAR